jgi:hypothetical protein
MTKKKKNKMLIINQDGEEAKSIIYSNKLKAKEWLEKGIRITRKNAGNTEEQQSANGKAYRHL